MSLLSPEIAVFIFGFYFLRGTEGTAVPFVFSFSLCEIKVLKLRTICKKFVNNYIFVHWKKIKWYNYIIKKV